MNPLPIAETSRLAVAGYLGEAASLLREYRAGVVPQRIRTFSQTAPDDLVAALQLLALVPDAAIVIHGPAGCGSALRYLAPGHTAWYVSNVGELDTVMGGDDKLKEAILLADRQRPATVFVVATPSVSVNNDDIAGALEELRPEVAARLVPVYATGFRSKVAATGWDLAWQALFADYRPSLGAAGGGEVLIPALAPREALTGVVELLDSLELKTVVVPAAALPERAPLCTVGLDPDLGDLPGLILAERLGSPQVRPPYPAGIAGTGSWLAAVGEAAGLSERARALHEARAAELDDLVRERPLAGRRVALALPPAQAFAVATLVRELGGELALITVTHLDLLHVEALEGVVAEQPELVLHVADGQHFELASLLNKSKPDLFVSTLGHPVVAARLGIPGFSVRPEQLLGYRGVRLFARLAGLALSNPAFSSYLAQNCPLPYREAWYRRSQDWHIKLEVA